MSTTMIQQIDSTTERVVARPTPSAPPVTENPVLTPINVISKANTTLFDKPCHTSPGDNNDKVCSRYAVGVTFNAGALYRAAPKIATALAKIVSAGSMTSIAISAGATR